GLVLDSCIPVAKSLPGSFLPIDNKTKFQVTLRAPEGTSSEETLLYAERAAVALSKTPEVTQILTTVAENDQRTRNYAQLYVDLTDPSARKASQFDLMSVARKIVPEVLPSNMRVNIAEVPDFAVGSNLQNVQYILSEPDYGVLQESASKIIDVI